MRYYTTLKSPVGILHLIANEKELEEIIFDNSWKSYRKKNDLQKKTNNILRKTQKELDLYFSHKLKKFTIPCSLKGTPLQIATWTALTKIPYGVIVSYSEQAKKINKPKAVRFVGTTNGKNPIPIIIPCHRVIGKSGKLVGYSSGLEIKEFLLRHEGVIS
jgi:methylated-DNA-[protein]-cysteine S-methyltransferase